MAGWRDLLESVFATWVAGLGVELPFSPRALASLDGQRLPGHRDRAARRRRRGRGTHREALDALGVLIEQAERGR